MISSILDFANATIKSYLMSETGESMNHLNDWELFYEMQAAEQIHAELLAEYRRRGLHEKAFCEFSSSRPTTNAGDSAWSCACGASTADDCICDERLGWS